MNRLLAAAIVVGIWAAITIGSALVQTEANTSLQDLVARHLSWGVLAAAAFLLIASRLLGWRDIGLGKPHPKSSIWLWWLPVLYLVFIGGTGMLTGRIGHEIAGLILVNTLLVGFSEELAFRGVFWGGARQSLPFWPAFFLVSAAFGSVHLLNAFVTGEFAGAGVQAFNAFMSGAAYLALRIRTHSIWPIMLFHGLWDFAVFAGGASASSPAAPAADLWRTQLFGGLILVGPLFLYGIWLVRNERVRSGWRDDEPYKAQIGAEVGAV